MIMIDQPNTFSLDSDRGPFRQYARPSEQRQNDYEKLYDRNTVYADIFISQDKICAVGPPLLNLKAFAIDLCKYRANGSIILKPRNYSAWKTERVYFDLDDSTSRTSLEQFALQSGPLKIEIDTPGFLDNLTTRQIIDLTPRFSGSRLLATYFQGCSLSYLLNWVLYHVKVVGFDSLVIYCPGDQKFSINDLKESLTGIHELKECVLVDWTLPEGPRAHAGSSWDSDYGYNTALEHLRLKYATCAHSLMFLDVDEVAIPPVECSFFELQEGSDNLCGLVPANFKFEIDAGRGEDSFEIKLCEQKYSRRRWLVRPTRLRDRQLGVFGITGMRPMEFAIGEIAKLNIDGLNTRSDSVQENAFSPDYFQNLFAVIENRDYEYLPIPD